MIKKLTKAINLARKLDLHSDEVQNSSWINDASNELRRLSTIEESNAYYVQDLRKEINRLSDLLKKNKTLCHTRSDITKKVQMLVKEDRDTQIQCDLFDDYLEEHHDGRVKHIFGAYGYDEAEWEAFQYGWNAAKKHFKILEKE